MHPACETGRSPRQPRSHVPGGGCATGPTDRARPSPSPLESVVSSVRHPMRFTRWAPRLTVVALALAAPLALLAVFDPASTWWLPSCPFHALTGWLCPLCGSLRAVHALLHGAP